MGEIYARHSGEPEAVAQAIGEHYWPYAGDAAPSSVAGLALSLADKLDSLAGLRSRRMPTGSADPSAWRQVALGIVNALLATQLTSAWRKGWRRPMRSSPCR